MLSEAGATASARETTIKWTSVLKSLAYTGGHPLGQPIHEGIDLHLKGILAQKEPCLWKHKAVACGSAKSTQGACPACSSQVSFPKCEHLTQLLQQACSQAGHDNRMSTGTPAAAAAAVHALLPLSGCSQCWQHCSREHQRALGEAGAVQHLLQELKSLAAAQQQQQQQQQQHAMSTSDTLQALLFACCGHPSNLQQLVDAGAVQQLAQVLMRPAGSSEEVQLACGLLGEAAAAVAAAGQLLPCLAALQHAAMQHKQQLLLSGDTAAACSSCCAVVWSTRKAAAAAAADLCQRKDDGSSSGSNSKEQLDALQSVTAAVEGTVLPVLAAAAKAAGAAAGGMRHDEQQQHGLLLMLCLSGCAQLLQLYEQQRSAHLVEPVASVSVVQQAVQDVLDALGLGRLRQVMQAYWEAQQQQQQTDSTGSALQEQQHGLQHLSSCQFLSVLQQLHSSAAAAPDSSSGSLLRPMSVSCVPAGATATIEVVYAGSPASEKAPSSCDDKEYGLVTSSNGSKAKARLSSSSSRERSPSDDSSSRGAGHPDTQDAAACRQAQQQQQLVDEPVDSQHNIQPEQQQSVQAPSVDQVLAAPAKTADSAPAERQPGMPQQSRSASSLCPIYADPEASSSSASVSTRGTLPPRSELCSSASSSSIHACGDGQSGTPAGTAKPEGAQSGQGESPNGGSSSGDDANRGPGRGSDHTSGNSGSSGDGGGSGNSGGGSGGDDHHGDDGHDGPTCTSPPSDDTTATGTALSTSSDSIVLSPMAGSSAAPSAAAAAAEASVSLGCSASDPVIVPRPSALGALPGLMLRGSPASLGGAAGPMSGATGGLGAPGTPPAGATSSSLGFSFPTNLASLNIGGHNAPQAGLAAAGGCTPGGLADVLLSPSAFGARGLMGQGGMPGQGSGAGMPGRRASDAGTVGGSSMLGGWGSAPFPTQGQTRQPGIMPVGSWPSAAPGLGALEEHRQGQQQQQQQQQRQQRQQVMAAARSAGSDPAAERSGLSNYLHMLNPGLVGLIGSTDTAGTLGPVGGYTHLMSWLTEPASGLSSAGSGSTNAPTQAAAAAAGLHSTGGPPGVPGVPGRACAQASAAAAAGSSQAAGSLKSQSLTDLHPSGSSNSTGGDGSTDVRPQRDQRTPPAAPSSAAAAAGSGAAPGLPKPVAPCAQSAKVLSGPAGLGEAQAAPAAAGGQLGLATAGSGSISSSGSLVGSSFSGMAHSYSGESLEDLDAMRMSSASFAAALAEAEAIAANVAASMQQHQQQQAAHAAAAAAARSAAGHDGKAEGSALQTDSSSGASAQDPAGDDESSGPAYDPAELTKGAPSRHLWLGNLHQRLPRSLLRSTFERFGPVEDVVTFPGRMYAFVNFREPADAAKAAQAVQDKEVPTITGNRRLVVKFRPSRRALGKVAEAMVPGLVDPASAANSDRGSGSMPCSHAGSYSNLAASAAAGSAAGHSRTSSNASLAVLQPGGGSSNALARAGSDASPTPDEAASARSGGSSIAGASSSRDLARVGSAASHGSLSVPDLPPGLTQQPQQLQQQFEDAAANRAFQAGGAPGGLSSAAAAAAAAVAAAAAAVASGSSDSNAAAAAHVAAAAAALAAVDAGLPQGPGLSGSELSLGDDVDIPEGKPSRHLWLGNIPLKPNRGAMEALFSRFGPLESVRVFPGKTFAFVNFVQANHAIAAKAALDGQPSPVITGPKPMVIRFQKDHAGAPPGTAAAKALEVAAARARKAAAPRTSLTGGLGGLLTPTATGSLAGPAGLGGDEDLVAEPAVNLSNKLNPNNIHYDRELAARYKRMSKAEKEALWAQDRALQQLEQNPAAASLLSAAAAAAAAAAAGSGPSLSAFDHSSLQAHPAAAAAAASSLYGQLLANPQLAVALAAQGNTAAAAAAAAAGLLQSNHAAALAGGGSGPWNAMGAGALGAAGLGPSNAALAAAAAAAAASGRMGGYYGQMAGLGGGDHMQGANLQQYLAAGGLSNQVLQQALLRQQLANSYSGLPGTPQEQATLAALSALDPSLLQTHLTSALGPHALGHRLSGLGSGLSMQGSGLSMQGSLPQQGQVGLPSTPSVGAGGVGSLLGTMGSMPPNSPGPSMGRYSSSGVGFGAGGGLRTNAPPRGSYTGSGLESAAAAAAAGAGAYQQFRASNSGSGLGGLGPIGPSAGPSGRDGLFMDYSQQQQQGGLLSPTWSGGGAFSGGGSQAPAPAPAPHRWPQQFLCPLSNQLMSDPVVAADGVTYQRDAITDWMHLRDVSPVTGRHLGSAVLQPDFQLRAAIASEVAKVQSSGGLM